MQPTFPLPEADALAHSDQLAAALRAAAEGAARVTLVAEPRVVADYDPALPGWRIAPGRYRVAIAHDDEDEDEDALDASD